MRNAECGIEEEGIEARPEGGHAAGRWPVYSAFPIPHSAFSRAPTPARSSEALSHSESPRALMSKLPVILAITGASGAPYGVRPLELLAVHNVPTWLLVSSHGWRLPTEACGIKDAPPPKPATARDWARGRGF